jgi:hypothetical protein
VGPGLAGDVRRNLTVYAGGAGRPPVRVVYVAGASPELLERLGETIEVPIRDFDPLAGAVGLDVTAGARGSFAGAAGLLFARAEARGLPINFVQPRQPRPPRDPKNRRIALVAAAAAVALVVGAVCCWMIYSNAVRSRDFGQAQQSGLDAKLQQSKKDGKLIRDIADWHKPVVLDEIYNLTALIPDVNALRITMWEIEPMGRTAKAKYTSRITLTGTCAGDPGRKALDALIDGCKKDGHYTLEGTPDMKNNQFTLKVIVERRAPSDYTSTLKSSGKKGQNEDMPDDFGDFLP